MSHKIWQKQFDSQLLVDYHLIAVDLPGHGKSTFSSNPEKDYTLPGYANILSQVITRLDIDQYILIGYSLGGNTSVEALPYVKGCIGIFLPCATIIGRPAALDKAFHPTPVLNTFFTTEASKDEIGRLIQAYFTNSIINTSIDSLLYDDFVNTDPHCRGFLGKSVMEGNYSDEIQILQNFQMPIAVVAGEEDKIGNNQYLINLDLPKWKDQVHLIPDAGHLPQWEQANAFNQLLAAFAEDCIR
jgi:pimeloyl-ACP methyl ester carboxylesterase